MNRRTLAILGAVVVVAAIVVFFAIHKGDHDSDDNRDDQVADKTDRTAPVRASGNQRNQRGSEEAPRVLIDDDPEGNLQLEGRVEDKDHNGVPGAIVYVDTNPPRHVKAEEDGSFAITRLVGRQYRLAARSDLGVAGPLTVRLTENNDPVILTIRPSSTIEVTVVDAQTKKPVPSATVEVRGLATLTGTTDNSGVAVIRQIVSGGYELAAFAPGYAKQHSRIRVPRDAETTTARLTLRHGAPVSGVVLSPDGKPVEGATVRYQGASEWAQSADPRRDAAETDAQGKFSFDALPAGTFRFEAMSATYAPGYSEMVTLDGTTEKTGVEVKMEPGATIRGKVVSNSGDPVGTAEVRVRVVTRSMRLSAARQVIADDEGKFEITGLAQKPVELVAVHGSGASEITEVDLSEPPAVREVTITLDLDGTIEGVVVGTDGEPIEGAQVTAMLDWRSRSGSRRAMRSSMWFRGIPQELSDAGGRFKIGGLEDGDYMVRASRSAGGFRGFRGRDAQSAHTGDKNVEIVLPQEGSIVGKVAFKSGDPPEVFYIRTGGWGRGTPFSTKDGSFELHELPPREYSLTVSGPGFDKKSVAEIDVKEGEKKDVGTITVNKGRTISGRVVSEGGSPISDATVRAGRMLFGDGSSSSAGRGGPPMARNAKETTTDDNGEFELSGVGMGDLSIVAEHEVEGRSKTMYLPGSGQSIVDLTLSLGGFGALEGTVTKSGQPAADIIVNAASTTAPAAVFGVASGPDGKFRFDRLAPDTYKVSAMTGRNPMRGFGYFPTLVTVQEDSTATANLEIESGNVTLSAEVVDPGGAELNFSMLFAVAGPVNARTARQLQLSIGAFDGFTAQAFSIRGNPAEFHNLNAGKYNVCAVPYPPEVQGMGETMSYMEREGDNLKVFCQEAIVAASPEEQSIAIEIEVPEFVPAPKGDEG